MQHQYPFCVLYFSMDTDLLDVNVHPTKMELRFSNNEAIYKTLFEIIRGALTHKDFIPEVPVQEEKIRKRENIKAPLPEPFERRGVEWCGVEEGFSRRTYSREQTDSPVSLRQRK